MNVLDLFSGIGGFSLGLERAGMRTVAFCEINEYCRRILKKHWPDIPCYEDVRTLTRARLRADGIVSVDAICGGFPCQDISLAGNGAGLEGEKSGLWREYARIIEEFRPAWVIIENVAALRGRGLDAVLGTLAALGFDAEWHCIPASAVGAPHQRDRIWIIAHANHDIGRRIEPERGSLRGNPLAAGNGASRFVAHSACGGQPADGRPSRQAGHADLCGAHVVNPDMPGCKEQRWPSAILTQLFDAERSGWWRSEPNVGRVADGIPDRVDRLTALGNAVVPQIPELIGRAIMRACAGAD